MPGRDLEKHRREKLRWYLLDALYHARPTGTNEEILLEIGRDLISDVTKVEVRKELEYLHDRKLVEVTDRDTPTWFAKINRYGVDFCEYAIDAEPGIARPHKYWD